MVATVRAQGGEEWTDLEARIEALSTQPRSPERFSAAAELCGAAATLASRVASKADQERALDLGISAVRALGGRPGRRGVGATFGAFHAVYRAAGSCGNARAKIDSLRAVQDALPPLSEYRVWADCVLLAELRDAGRAAEADAELRRALETNNRALAIATALPWSVAELKTLERSVFEGAGFGRDASERRDEIPATAALATRVLLANRAAIYARCADLLRDDGLLEVATGWNRTAQDLLDLSGRRMAELSRTVAEQRVMLRLGSGRFEECISEATSLLQSPELGLKNIHEARLLVARGAAKIRLGFASDALEDLEAVHGLDGAGWRSRWSAAMFRAHVALAHAELVEPDEALSRLDELMSTGSTSQPIDRAQYDAVRAAVTDSEESRAALRRSFAALTDSWAARDRRDGGRAHLRDGRVLETLQVLCRGFLDDPSLEDPAHEVLGVLAAIHATAGFVGESGSNSFVAADVLRQLEECDAGILIVLPGPRGSLTVAVDAEGAVWSDAPPRSALLDKAKKASRRIRLNALQRPGSPYVDASGLLRSFASDLLSPDVLEKLESWESIALVGGELLADFPVECLPIGDTTFGERWALGYLPSLAAASDLRDRAVPRVRNRKVMVVGGARMGEWARTNLRHLEPIEMTRPQLSGLYESRHSVVELLWAEDGSRDALTDSDLSDYDQLVVVSHGVRLAGEERFASILLDEGEGERGGSPPVFDAALIEGLRLPPLVVFASCGAGLEARRHGAAGSAGLTGACFSAGAAAIVEPFGDVPLAPIAEMLRIFEQRTARGASAAVALRDARRHLSAVYPGVPTGAFLHVVGWGFEGQQTASKSGRRTLLLLAGWATAAMLIVVGARRLRSERHTS